MKTIIDQVVQFADKAHGEQKRKYTPERYIVHPLRVMHTCREVTDDICILCAAILHDVLEDTPVTASQLKDFLKSVLPAMEAERTLQLVTELTDVFTKKAYPSLNRRARKARELCRQEKISADAQTIKYADIIDNSREIAKQDPDFAKIFLYECLTSLMQLNKGNSALYQKALHVVKSSIAEIKKPACGQAGLFLNMKKH